MKNKVANKTLTETRHRGTPFVVPATGEAETRLLETGSNHRKAPFQETIVFYVDLTLGRESRKTARSGSSSAPGTALRNGFAGGGV